MAGFDEVPFGRIAERNHFCNLIANQQNGAIGICRVTCDDCLIFSDVCLNQSTHAIISRGLYIFYPLFKVRLLFFMDVF